MKVYRAITDISLRMPAACLILAFLGACASTAPPIDQLARSQAAINQAEQVGARDYAPLEIREAIKKLEQARELVDKKQYERATRLADQAEVDAELAEAKTLSGKAQKAVRELRESIKILREEILKNKQNKDEID